jgi:hypothetical protein
MDWRETEPHLSADYLDHQSGELMTLVHAKLPFERVRDGDMTAWLLRAEHAGVISGAERRQLMSELRRAREKRELTRGSLL